MSSEPPRMVASEVVPDPKPAARVRADLKDWTAMRSLLQGPCQVCGVRSSVHGMSLHHVVPRSAGGSDVPENLAVLCGHGTVGCHGDVEARRNGARERLRLNMTDDQIRYATTAKSLAWLERHYPYLSANREKEASDV